MDDKINTPGARKYTTLKMFQKKEICDYVKEHKYRSQQFVADLFTAKFKKIITRRTIGNLIKKYEEIKINLKSMPNNKKRVSLKYGIIDSEMILYVEKNGSKRCYFN